MGGVQTDVKLGPQESSGFRCCPDSDRNSASQPAAGWVTNTSLQQRILTLEMANYGAGAKPSMVRKSDTDTAFTSATLWPNLCQWKGWTARPHCPQSPTTDQLALSRKVWMTHTQGSSTLCDKGHRRLGYVKD